MLTHAPVVQDPSRLNALRRIGVLETPAEECFDRLTRIAAAGLHAPVSLISLVDEDRQFFKSCLGLPEPWASDRETPLTHSICQHVVAAREPLVVVDAREHQALRGNLAMRDLGVVAYLGVPLITSAGVEIGALCVIDHEPRAWSAGEVALLRDLAATAVTLTRIPRRPARAAGDGRRAPRPQPSRRLRGAGRAVRPLRRRPLCRGVRRDGERRSRGGSRRRRPPARGARGAPGHPLRRGAGVAGRPHPQVRAGARRAARAHP